MNRDILTIGDLTNEEIMRLFQLADSYLATRSTVERPYRISSKCAESSDIAKGFSLSTLFYEMSTRTRLSFETSMHRMGGEVTSFGDPSRTSVGKGETLADTVRVMENYADLIVLRHPSEGAARVAAEFSNYPVINAGDGSHEHPTQTLCDLYTLYREKGALGGLRVLILGDLKNGRTVHSLVFGLARFGAAIVTMSGKGLNLPDHVSRRLKEEFGTDAMPLDELRKHEPSLPNFDVVYSTPFFPHQPALFTGTGDSKLQVKIELVRQIVSRLDVLYVTRLQSERMAERAEGKTSAKKYPVVDKKFLREDAYHDAKVMHPLPRVNELAYELDKDPRGTYFKQAGYAVPIRMALIASLLKLKGAETTLNERGPNPSYQEYPHSTRIKCANEKCITNSKEEHGQIKQRFWIIRERPALLLRCDYCDNERSHQEPEASLSRKARSVSKKSSQQEVLGLSK
jgi:aspartate carbamoyltransferase catalytic subunit